MLRAGRPGRGAAVALVAWALAAPSHARQDAPADDREHVRGMTVSCPRSGQIWATDAFAAELDELAALGCNWVAIHPYAAIRADGTVAYAPLDREAPPAWLARPLREARARGMGLLIKPHLAYWGSPFEWRGAIDFEPGPARERFWATYSDWIEALARAAGDVDGFAVGCELSAFEADDARWRSLIARVRSATDAPLTYAANWDRFATVPFWDALDAVGVQAYFPLADAADPEPTAGALADAWEPWVAALRAVHERSGKPVVLTELGYPRSLAAAVEPWRAGVTLGPAEDRAAELQRRCLGVALARIEREREWLRGAFLWKCFPGDRGARADFALESPSQRAVLAGAWRAAAQNPSPSGAPPRPSAP